MAPSFQGPLLSYAIAGLAVAALFGNCESAIGQNSDARFLAPPRTIADITAILDQEKPDSQRLAKLRAEGEAAPPKGADRGTLATFHFKRAQARTELGRMRDATADTEKAIELGRGQGVDVSRFKQFYQMQLNYLGDPKRRLQVLNELASEVGNQGRRHGVYRQLAETYLQLGDLKQTENYVRLNQARFAESRGFGGFPSSGSGWEANVLQGNARLLEMRGQFREAEVMFRRARAAYQADRAKWTPDRDGGILPMGIELQVDVMLAFEGRAKARQGRYAEGEADVRRALLGRLKGMGKYHLYTAQMIGLLANVVAEQGRYAEAEQLMRAQIDIFRTLRIDEDSQSMAQAWSRLATIQNLADNWTAAAESYRLLDAATRSWEPARRETLVLSVNQIATLYGAGNLEAGISAAERLLQRQKGLYGEQHVETALARGMLAIGLAKAGRDEQALREFKLAIPVLLTASHESDRDDTLDAAAREQRTQIVVEAYMAVLARVQQERAAAETFQLAEGLRGRSVQKALAAASARMVAAEPALAEIARKEQDLEKQIAAQLAVLNNALAQPSELRSEKSIREMTADIDKLRVQRATVRKEIEKRFPSYSELLDPRPPRLEDVSKVLLPDEAFVALYFGREIALAWAIRKDGRSAFAVLALSAGELETKVRLLREPFEADAARISDVLPFDVGLAHEVYAAALQPVRAGWEQAKNLVVATNGALGLLPIGLLPTAPPDTLADAQTPFVEYRSVPWLIRSHGVSTVPSAAALRTLRQLPPGSAARETLLGFGDPFFSKEQAQAAERSETTPLQVAAASGARGLPFRRRALPRTDQVDSAELALLPRLPDTADELRSIATALQADPAKVLNLGRNANERKVKTTDLSRYRIIAFATHGLVPGDLNGLAQPALALTAPDVADVDGDGLLTMGEILGLKLDADWVVLSACNTGSGAGAGAEAASGLGRAFFYAGSRALLVTNWSVHSVSARDLVTDVFHRQAADPQLSRAEALRQSMVALMDGPGFVDAGGNTLFAYAHPLFWAPFTIIGEGGSKR